jgi:hypothetical protein
LWKYQQVRGEVRMMQVSLATKAVSWLVIVLMLNLCACELCLAQETTQGDVPGSAEGPDTTKERPDTAGTWPDSTDIAADTTMVDTQILEPNREIFPYGATEDSLMLGAGHRSREVYREWWLWTVAVVVVTTTIILYSGGEEDAAKQDLPGFPEPPER